MRRLRPLTFDEIIAYNLRDGGNEFTIFEETQYPRVVKARQLVEGCLAFADERARIVELGCSAGDIIGVFASEHDCVGYDVTPGACRAARERYPDLTVIETAVEHVTPEPCDVLILCEFLEHIVNPLSLIEAWMPLARSVVIGHPLDDHMNEPGHLWSYDTDDFDNWFSMGGHIMDEAYTFDMGHPMIIGRGHRR